AKDNFNRQLFGDGIGIMAIVTEEVASGNDIPVDSTRFFAEGQQLDVLSSDGSPKAEMREVLAVDDINSKITLSGNAMTLTTGDIITHNGSYGQELSGLGAIMKPDTEI